MLSAFILNFFFSPAFILDHFSSVYSLSGCSLFVKVTKKQYL